MSLSGRRLLLAGWLLALAACERDRRTPVLVYSPHGRDQLMLLEAEFERLHPDVDIRWLDLGSQEILDRLRFERVNAQADVWFGGPTTVFDRGIRDSLLQPYRPVWAEHVDRSAWGPDDLYFGVYRTPAVIAYNSDAVKPEDAPKDWDDVLDPRWHDEVLIRDPMASGTMRAIWGLIIERSIRETGDTSRGMAWLRRLDGQTRAYALNPAILDAKLARREGLVTLWDLPDILISRGRACRSGMSFRRVARWSSTMQSAWFAAAVILTPPGPSSISWDRPRPRCSRPTRSSAFRHGPTSSGTRFRAGSRA